MIDPALPALEVRDVTKRFHVVHQASSLKRAAFEWLWIRRRADHMTALADLSFTVPRGQTVGVVGLVLVAVKANAPPTAASFAEARDLASGPRSTRSWWRWSSSRRRRTVSDGRAVQNYKMSIGGEWARR